MLDLLNNAKLAKQLYERKQWREDQNAIVKEADTLICVKGIYYVRGDLVPNMLRKLKGER